MKRFTQKIAIAVLLLGIGVFPASLYALTDPAGALVHHNLNITNAPYAKGMSFSRDGKELWATLLLNKSRGLTIFDTSTGKKVTDINLSGGGGVEIIFTKDGSRAYVSQMETGRVFEIDAGTKKILRTFKTGGVWTKVLALSSDEETLYASNWQSNNVSVINLETGALSKKISTITTPRGLYPTSDGKYLYVAGFDKGELQKIDLATGTKKVLIKTGGAFRHIVGDETTGILYISDMGKRVIWKLDLGTDTLVKFATTDANPNTIELSSDGKILFVSCRGKNNAETYYKSGPEWGSVLLFDTANGKLLDAIVGGNQPTALSVSGDGTTLAFSDFLDSRIEMFSIPSYEILKTRNGGRSAVYKNYMKK